MTYQELVCSLREKCEKADVSSVKDHVAIQFNVWGEAEGAFYLEIKEGRVYVEPYEYYDRDVLVTVSDVDLIKIFKGDKSFIDAYNNGELQAQGDLGKALALKEVLAVNNGTAKKSVVSKAKSAVATAKAVKKAVSEKKASKTTSKKETEKKTVATKKTVKK